MVIWGTGNPRREFLHVDDMAAASLFVLGLDRATYEANTRPMQSHINVGTGDDVAILDLARLVARIIGYQGQIAPDASRPDGTARKLLDVSRLADMGWTATIGLEDGIATTYRWYLNHEAQLRT